MRPSRAHHIQSRNHRADGPVGGNVQSSGGGPTSDCAVVCTVNLTFAGPEESICTVEDESEQVDFSGAPPQARDTGKSNPFTGVNVSV